VVKVAVKDNMMKFIDISMPLHADLPKWPGTKAFTLNWDKRIENGDECNNSSLSFDTHFGTHIDAPLHFVHNGQPLHQLDLTTLIGPAQVIHIPNATSITGESLASMQFQTDTCRMLFKTRNSDSHIFLQNEFQKDFTALDESGAQWLVDHGNVKLIGMDYLSVQKYDATKAVHEILLKAGIIILEGLNLANVLPGVYELICLPLNLVGAEGGPARAILRPLES
jgi:arylformamidase